jgi:hypothetical protein
MADWPIKIIPADDPKDPPQFVCELQRDNEPGLLLARARDSIHWYNGTTEPQRPWPTDANFKPLPPEKVGPRGQPKSNYLSDEIAKDHSSRPTWIAFGDAGTEYKYCSLSDPRAQGIIRITK